VGSERGAGNEWGLSTGVVSVVRDVGRRWWRNDWFRDKLGRWNAFFGCPAGSSPVRRRFGAAGGGPESGRAVVEAVVHDDVAMTRRGSRYGLGVWGTRAGGNRVLLGLRLEFWGERVCFVEQTTRSNERVCTSSCNSVC
jgi:hypothetical protein